MQCCQDKLLAVVDAFVRTAPQASGAGSNHSNGGSAAAGSPVYHGHNRGLAGNLAGCCYSYGCI